MIAECSFKIGQKSDKWPHLNPEDATRIAKEACAKKLALVHFDADIYRTMQDRRAAEAYAQKIFNNTYCAMDGMEIEI